MERPDPLHRDVSPETALSAALSYLKYGWSPIPVPQGQKAPRLKNWQDLRVRAEDAPSYFAAETNIGVLLGEPSRGLIDIDLDCGDALFLASEFLPTTGAVFGRHSNPASHWLFVVHDHIETLRLKGADGSVLLELRSTGTQTVFPPSVHSGERVEWTRSEAPRAVDSADLRKSVVLLAIACLVVPDWPVTGSRHERSLALAGGLLGDNLDVESVRRVIRGVCRAAGDDEPRDRLETIASTAEKLARHQPATGWTSFRRHVDGAIVDRIRSFVALITPGQEKSFVPSPTVRLGHAAQEEKKNAAERLLGLARVADLYHTPEKECFALIQVDDHVENWPLQSREFRGWLSKRCYETHGKPPAREAMHDALDMLGAKALFDGPERTVFTRVGWKGSDVFLDLCNTRWSVVRIAPEGWTLLDISPVQFRRSRGMLALPIPVAGGSLDALRTFIPAEDERSWRLLTSWLIVALSPQGPFPILVLQGEAGTAKSTTSLFLRSLIDPSIAPLRSISRDDRDLMISAQNSWVISFDNLSRMPPWFSDALCRLATGGGLATRELYSNDAEKIFDAMRPIVINGIDDLAVRDDLSDRALVVNLGRIPENKRRLRRELLGAFEEARPRLLGALLSILSSAFGRLQDIHLPTLPRMADFAHLIAAAEPALNWAAGSFMRIYLQDRVDAAASWIESDVVAVALLQLLAKPREWKGTFTELLVELNALTDSKERQHNSWPQSAQALSNRVRRAAPSLRSLGMTVDFDRESHTRRRLVILRYQPENGVPRVPSGPSLKNLRESPSGGTNGDTANDISRPGAGTAGADSTALASDQGFPNIPSPRAISECE